MKLHDAMRKTVREYGVRVISEKRLIFILADLRAFEEYPAVKPVLEAIVSGDTGKELVRLFLEENRDWFLSYAGNLKKSLSGKSRFRDDLADYAVGSILFGLGVQESVTEPTDHGFDPMGHGSGAAGNGTGAQKARNEEADKGRAEGNAGRGKKEWDAGVTRREHSGEKAPEIQGSRAETAGSGSAAPGDAGSKSSSNGMKWVIAIVLIAGIAFGWMEHSRNSGAQHQTVYGTAEQESSEAEFGNSAGTNSSVGKSGDNDARKSECEAFANAEEGKPEKLVGEYEWRQGEMYYSELSVSKDYSEAAKWFRKSADLGNARGYAWLGVMYMTGAGVSLNHAESLKWICKSVGHGDAFGEELLGIMYFDGLIVRKDYSEALKWFRKSAEHGNETHGVAEEWLGKMYESGLGVNRDFDVALQWYRKAAAHGNEDAQTAVRRLEKLVSGGGRQ